MHREPAKISRAILPSLMLGVLSLHFGCSLGTFPPPVRLGVRLNEDLPRAIRGPAISTMGAYAVAITNQPDSLSTANVANRSLDCLNLSGLVALTDFATLIGGGLSLTVSPGNHQITVIGFDAVAGTPTSVPDLFANSPNLKAYVLAQKTVNVPQAQLVNLPATYTSSTPDKIFQCPTTGWVSKTATQNLSNGSSSTVTDAEFALFGGQSGTGVFTNILSLYNPVTDSWRNSNPPGGGANGEGTSLVWDSVNQKLVAFGGYFGGTSGSGYTFAPSTGLWALTNSSGSPSARAFHSSVFTGSEVIVYGGRAYSGGTFTGDLNDGARYSVANDSWTAMASTNAPPNNHRQASCVQWIGSGMFFRGNGVTKLYRPVQNSWTDLSNVNAPSTRQNASCVLMGSKVMIWGGSGSDSNTSQTNTGAVYDPDLDSWTTMPLNQAPFPRDNAAAVWTGSLVLITGGHYCTVNCNFDFYTLDMSHYDPATNSWVKFINNMGPLTSSDNTTYDYNGVYGKAYYFWLNYQMQFNQTSKSNVIVRYAP